MFKLFRNIDSKEHKPQFGGLDIFKYIGSCFVFFFVFLYMWLLAL